MKVTIASGKGGTGKTTVTASLASVWDTPLVAVDLDVEEPNLHLFLRPELEKEVRSAWMEIPVLDPEKCNLCRQCVDLCQFKAISLMISTLTLYPDMCHGCGGCIAICEQGALTPGRRELGTLYRGRIGKNRFLSATLRIGEAMSPPLMEEVKKEMDGILASEERDALIDAPPGVSCPAICAVVDSDAIVLVTDETPFGFHDFRLAHQSFSPFGKPMGAVINRAGVGTDEIYHYCEEHAIPILAKIPFDRAIAEGYSRGRIIADVSDELHGIFSDLRDRVRELARGPAKGGGHA